MKNYITTTKSNQTIDAIYNSKFDNLQPILFLRKFNKMVD
jgi:hypothetical protein